MYRKTKTTSFGSLVRESHDSRQFYSSKLFSDFDIPKNVEYNETKIPDNNLDKLYAKSSESMDEIPNNSVHLMITSPPYNVGKEYDNDLTLEEYEELLTSVFRETYKKLVTGGRACINIANIGRKPYIPLHSLVINIMLDLNFLMRGEIIWDKSASAGGSCAWGSWMSASNPVLRDYHEYILVFSKDVNAKRIGHPAPFPVELPHRLINLYSYEGDVVLDPFCGSGTTCLAALQNNRHYIGYDINGDYIDLSEKRISNHKSF